MKSIVALLILSLSCLCACGVKQIAVSDYKPIEVPDGKRTKPIALSKMVSKISRGTVVGDLMAGMACLKRGSITWRGGRANISDEEFTSAFYDELRRLNYNVVGNPNEIFDNKSSQAEFAVGGLINGLSLNICYPMARYGNMDSGSASAGMDIEWQVFNMLDRKTVFKKTTHGSANLKFSDGNSNEALYMAFSNALQGLLSDSDFYKLVSGQSGKSGQSGNSGNSGNSGDTSQTGEAKPDKQATSIAPYVPATPKDKKSMAEAQKSVVTIQVGSAHGSGFVISQDGLVVTNRHVVEDSDTARIVTSDGRKFDGQVLARNPRRDVAVISVDGLNLPALKIRTEPLEIGEEVYAIGSPLDLKLYGTVTKGIVSSFRVMNGQKWIQSDATINHGNSGGPLVDARGNVVGISTMIRTDGPGIYFFGPIEEALAVIGINKTQ